MAKEKSVLDGMEVKESGFPLGAGMRPLAGQPPQPDDLLEIVGHCPQCGAPVYGKSRVKEVTAPKYSCTCWRKAGAIEQTREIK